jgi:hypothetical protein
MNPLLLVLFLLVFSKYIDFNGNLGLRGQQEFVNLMSSELLYFDL